MPPTDPYRDEAEAIVAYLKEQHLAVSRYRYRLHARYHPTIGKRLDALAGQLLYTLGEAEAKLDSEEQDRLQVEAIRNQTPYMPGPIRTGPPLVPRERHPAWPEPMAVEPGAAT